MRMSNDAQKRCQRWASACLWLSAGLLAGCGGDDSNIQIPADEQNSRSTVTNAPDALAARYRQVDESLAISDGSGGAKTAAKAKAKPVLRLIAEVSPPTVDGFPLQATSTSLKSASTAVVSYNTQGEPYRGGIDLFSSVQGNSKPPELSSSITFNDTDVSHVVSVGGVVFAAEAASVDATGFSAPGAVERVTRNGKFLTLEGGQQTPLSSFAATSLEETASAVYVVTGSTGHVFKLSNPGLVEQARLEISDARWVAEDPASGNIVVISSNGPGNGGTLTVLDADLSVLYAHAFDGGDVAESKNTVELSGGRAYIAAGPAGIQVLDLVTGDLDFTVSIPSAAESGVEDEGRRVSNAVTIDDDLMFISNGEAGVYVVQAPVNFADANDAELQESTVLGKLAFDDQPPPSVNHVSYRGGKLYVAAGLGGLKIIDVSN